VLPNAPCKPVARTETVGVAAGAAHCAGGELIAATAKSASIKAMQIPALRDGCRSFIKSSFTRGASVQPLVFSSSQPSNPSGTKWSGRTDFRRNRPDYHEEKLSVFCIFMSIAADVDHPHSTTRRGIEGTKGLMRQNGDGLIVSFGRTRRSVRGGQRPKTATGSGRRSARHRRNHGWHIRLPQALPE
jgi:hypothetical protein